MDQLLKSLEHFKIIPRKKIIKGGKGNYRGAGLGNSLDFYGHKEYNYGEDLKKIDWKAYGRTQKLYTKSFEEEKQMDVNIILDDSLSMDFGEPNKWEMAKYIALGLGYMTLKQNDFLNFYTINSTLEEIMKKRKGKEHFYELTQKIKDIHPKGDTHFENILNMNHFSSGITFFISDFFTKELDKIIDFLTIQNQEVILFHVLSQQEINPLYGQELKLIDVETKESRKIEMNHQMKEIYKEKMKKFIGNIEKSCTSRNGRYVLSQTNDNIIHIFQKGLGGI
ncbi:DUF58 domain-containing protein [Anaerophilus nitritogenes]|uniref:DUF58 domain-containing protein n=1 Tax=Anaerophilus nitritogenes TaxID=2498136 RepID=UPI00101C2DF6|nr:DUF58 domain-containing protein [Anaerophilus nitritogenes]